MDYVSIILSAAKTAKVSGTLLLAICSHESNNFTQTFVQYDGGSPSHGICMVKESTARFLGYKGTTKNLHNPSINAKYSALYLKYQLDRYEGDTCKATAAYNAGKFNESKKYPGKPRNLKYIKRVQEKLPDGHQKLLSCEDTQ